MVLKSKVLIFFSRRILFGLSLSSLFSNCEILMLQTTTLEYHSPQNSLWQDKHNSPKNSPAVGDQMHLNGSSPQQLSPIGSSPNCEQNNLKRRSTESLQHIAELEKKQVRRDGWYFSHTSNVYTLRFMYSLIHI